MRLKDDPDFLADVNNTIAELNRIHKRLVLTFSLGVTVALIGSIYIQMASDVSKVAILFLVGFSTALIIGAILRGTTVLNANLAILVMSVQRFDPDAKKGK